MAKFDKHIKFLALHFFMHMLNISVLFKQSKRIKKLQ